MAGKIDQMKGKINQGIGRRKERKGQDSGDPLLEDEGTAQKIKGKVQSVKGKVKDAID